MNTITESMLTNMILRVGFRFVGLKEIKPNSDWDNPSTPGHDKDLVKELKDMMRDSPWKDGWAYCAAFVEGVVVTALRECGATPAQIKKFADKFSPHCMTSFRAFSKANLVHAAASPGAIGLAQHGDTDMGHAWLVITSDGDIMATLEANTSAGPSTPEKEREGDWITTKQRNVWKNGKLRTRGFIPISNILKLIYT